MKRVCTLRKVLRSFFKGPLRKAILSFLYIVWLFMTTKFLLFLNIVAFCRHSVLVVYEYLQPGDMLWKGKVALNICIRKKVVLLKFWYIYVSKFEETFICKREIDALPPIIRFAVFILLTEPSRIPLFNLLAIELLMAE